jgi:hypothetical protein
MRTFLGAVVVLAVLGRTAVAADQAEQSVKGVIQAVNLEKRQVSLKPGEKEVLTVEVTADTRIRVGGKDAGLMDLRAGQMATCVHTVKDGKHVCKSLTVD